MRNPHWHDRPIGERSWYAIAYIMGIGMALGCLLLVDCIAWRDRFRHVRL